MRVFKLILTTTVCLCVTRQSWAKCISVFYWVSGRISTSKGHAIAGAAITINSLGQFSPEDPTMIKTDLGGNYKTVVQFNTLSGDGPYGDRCGNKPSKAKVEVESNGYDVATRSKAIASQTFRPQAPTPSIGMSTE